MPELHILYYLNQSGKTSLEPLKTLSKYVFFWKQYLIDPLEEMNSKLFKALELAYTKYNIAKHNTKGLCKEILREQQKCKKGKRLDLEGKEDKGYIVYLLVKIVQVIVYQEVKEAK